jgi:hypothetical protein
MCLNNSEDRVLRVDLTRSVSAVLNHQESAREYRDELVEVRSGLETKIEFNGSLSAIIWI